jgi:hypothetical protein
MKQNQKESLKNEFLMSVLKVKSEKITDQYSF